MIKRNSTACVSLRLWYSRQKKGGSLAQIKVMTANLAGQARYGWNDRKEIARKVFSKTTADIIGFQEFGVFETGRTNWDVLGSARRELILVPGEVVGDIMINSLAYNPVMFEFIDFQTFWLHPNNKPEEAWGGKPRGATCVKLKERETRKNFLFYNIHLDNVSSMARKKGIVVILRHMRTIRDDENTPIIVVGDSNVSVDSPHESWRNQDLREPYEIMLRAGFVDTWTAVHGHPRPHTFHAFKGDRYEADKWGTWDTEWILARKCKPISCILIQDSVDSKYPSDHYWMESDIELHV